MSDLVPNQPVQPVELIQPPDNAPVNSPKWWVYQLDAELSARWPLVQCYEDYYEGRHKLTFASSRFRQSFGQMLAAIADNWIPLVIQASVERLKPQGFLFGENQKGDQDAWRIWQENYLDADAPLGFTEACKHGESYMLVWPEDQQQRSMFGFGRFAQIFLRRRASATPRITLEHPSQMVVRRVAGDRRQRAAALKRWQENTGDVFATLYLPDSIHYFQRDQDGGWQARDGRQSGKNPLGIVPVVPLVNEPHMLPCYPPSSLIYPPHNVPGRAYCGLGRSDQADAISTVDQVNKLLCDMMVASEVAAFRQRWATGLEVPRDEDTGEPREPFNSAVDRLWVAEGEEGENVKFGEFSATDLTNYIKPIENRITSLAARTRTPPHYLLGQMVNISGDALIAAEAGLSSKVAGKKTSFGEGLEEAIRLAFAWMNDDRAADMSAEVAWGQSEARSEAQHIDSLVKKLAIGVPKEQLWADAGYSPQQVQRFKTLLLEEAVIGNLGDKPNPPVRQAEQGQQNPVTTQQQDTGAPPV